MKPNTSEEVTVSGQKNRSSNIQLKPLQPPGSLKPALQVSADFAADSKTKVQEIGTFANSLSGQQALRDRLFGQPDRPSGSQPVRQRGKTTIFNKCV